MSNEARIGLLVGVAILVFFAGFYFLKGSNLFSSEYEYHAYYDNVQGLQPSAAVQIHGLQIGKVSEIKLNRSNMKDQVEVILAINKKTRLPVGTVAKLNSLDLLGTKGITLELGTSGDLYDNGAKVPSAVEGGIVDKISVEVTPLLQDVRKVVNNIDSVLTSVNDIFSPEARANLQNSIASLHVTMDNFSGLSSKLNGQSNALAHVIQNADKITTTLADGKLDATLTNLRTTTDKLSRAPLEEAINNVNAMAASLKNVTYKIDNNEGSLGLLVNDKQLYNNLTTTVGDLGRLSADLKAHPRRYVNLTIFGKKAKVGDQ
jgi:phospholipid/cholesterol/gamma-HCH transport system substrate-binding protein